MPLDPDTQRRIAEVFDDRPDLADTFLGRLREIVAAPLDTPMLGEQSPAFHNTKEVDDGSTR